MIADFTFSGRQDAPDETAQEDQILASLDFQDYDQTVNIVRRTVLKEVCVDESNPHFQTRQ